MTKATPILTTTTHLAAAADAICDRTGIGRAYKSVVLNCLAAAIAGDRHNWGFLTGAAAPVISATPKGHAPLETLLAAATKTCPEPAVHPKDGKAAESNWAGQPGWRGEAYDQAVFAFGLVSTGMDVSEAIEEAGLTEEVVEGLIEVAAGIFLEERDAEGGVGEFESLVSRFGTQAAIVDPIMDEHWTILTELIEERASPDEVDDQSPDEDGGPADNADGISRGN